MRQQRPCIFCNRYGDKSKEHFYPDWLSDVIEGQQGVHNLATVVTLQGESLGEVTSRSRRQGHLITKKFRVVCTSCNNGWMSVIENAAKPVLMPGIGGTGIALDPDAQLALAQWVCLKAMICEHSDPALALTPVKDRRAFFDDREIPGYFRIYVGTNGTKSVTWLHRHSATISFSSTVQPPLLDGLRRNVQTITFILGRWLFHVLAARVEHFGLDSDITYPGLMRLWPATDVHIHTGNFLALNAPQQKLLITSFERYVALQKRRFVPEII